MLGREWGRESALLRDLAEAGLARGAVRCGEELGVVEEDTTASVGNFSFFRGWSDDSAGGRQD